MTQYIAGTEIMDTVCDIQRASKTQDETMGTEYDFTNPQTIASQVQFSIQSAKPTEIESFSQRGVKISHKAYCVTATTAAQGDIIVDTRFTPSRRYVLEAPPEDMAGRGIMFGFFCWLIP